MSIIERSLILPSTYLSICCDRQPLTVPSLSIPSIFIPAWQPYQTGRSFGIDIEENVPDESKDDEIDSDCDDEPVGYYGIDIDDESVPSEPPPSEPTEPASLYGTDIDGGSVPSEPPPPEPTEPASLYGTDIDNPDDSVGVKDIKVESKGVSNTIKVLVKDLSEIDTNKYEIVHKQSMGSNRYLVFIKPKK